MTLYMRLERVFLQEDGHTYRDYSGNMSLTSAEITFPQETAALDALAIHQSYRVRRFNAVLTTTRQSPADNLS
jgi:hypothetical protein